MDSQVADRYAESLFALAEDENAVDVSGHCFRK